MRITLEEATSLIRARLSPLAPVLLPLFDALGCITAESVKAQMDQPPFPRSPYDGYALRATDSGGASRENPISLLVIGQSFAGKPAEQTVGKGEAVRIMTGGVIPEGADCVIPQELTDEGEQTVKIYKALKPFENYCRQGEDFQKDTEIVPCGITVTAAVAGVAASAGCTELWVFPKPRVAVLSTGDELQILGLPLEKGQIYSSNSPYLAGRLDELHLPISQITHVQDEISELVSAFRTANEVSDIIICTGGVSAGQKDLVPDALKRLGAEMIFHGVEMKPGMPAALAILNGKPVVALSGNPFACAVTFDLLARPALAVLASNPLIEARRFKATLSDGFPKARNVRRYVHGLLSEGTVSVAGEQGSGQLRTMIGSNCLAELPKGNEPLPVGTFVNVYMLEGSIYGG
ncbi:MAG: molybdopterin molybdenumtransferase MoeA [Firmicutes bacterium HGW-Firmicutes-16]|nr:MAG: molybdopterin molybdenumtransferase MoeA [Firmicutes bacterium HGW-Firmicutes-16]